MIQGEANMVTTPREPIPYNLTNYIKEERPFQGGNNNFNCNISKKTSRLVFPVKKQHITHYRRAALVK